MNKNFAEELMKKIVQSVRAKRPETVGGLVDKPITLPTFDFLWLTLLPRHLVEKATVHKRLECRKNQTQYCIAIALDVSAFDALWYVCFSHYTTYKVSKQSMQG